MFKQTQSFVLILRQKYVIIRIIKKQRGDGVTKEYILSVIVLQTDSNNSILNLIGAANAVLSKVVIGADGVGVNEFGEIERDRHNIHLKPCIWQYMEDWDVYIGYIEGEEDFPINIFTCLKERKK